MEALPSIECQDKGALHFQMFHIYIYIYIMRIGGDFTISTKIQEGP
jgi:hypothetical protein